MPPPATETPETYGAPNVSVSSVPLMDGETGLVTSTTIPDVMVMLAAIALGGFMPLVSDAITVNASPPGLVALVGVPDINPELGSIDKPSGKAPFGPSGVLGSGGIYTVNT